MDTGHIKVALVGALSGVGGGILITVGAPVLIPVLLGVGGVALYTVLVPDAMPRAQTWMRRQLATPAARLLPAPRPTPALPDLTAEVTSLLARPADPTAALLHTMLMQPTTTRHVIVPPAPLDASSVTLAYAPGNDARWCQALELRPEAVQPYQDRTPLRQATHLLAALAQADVRVQAATLGCTAQQAQTVGAWAVALVICDRAPDDMFLSAWRSRCRALGIASYDVGGTALTAVLAQPHAAPEDTDDGVTPATDDADRWLDTRNDVTGKVCSDQADVDADDADDADGIAWDDEEDVAGDTPQAAVTERGYEDDIVVAPALLPMVDDERDELPELCPTPLLPDPSLFGRRTAVTQTDARATDDELLRAARPRWPVANAMPTVAWGVVPQWARASEVSPLLWSPMEPSVVYGPSQRGKTTLVLYLLRQALLAAHPTTRAGVAAWYMTTKWQETTMHGVEIGRLLRRAYNLQRMNAPCGIEGDGSGTVKMLHLLERELDARVNGKRTTTERLPIWAIADEWAFTVKQLHGKTFRKGVNPFATDDDLPTDGSGNPWQLTQKAPETPLDVAVLAVERLIRQGFGERMPLLLVTQDGQKQNNAINLGLLASFPTVIGHTALDGPSLNNISRGDKTIAAQITALRERQPKWDDWFLVRAGVVTPFSLPPITNDVLNQWDAELDRLPTPMHPVPVARAAASATVPVLDGTDVRRWPDGDVQRKISRLSERERGAFVAVCARAGVQVPIVGCSEAQRRTLLGLDGMVGNGTLLALLTALQAQDTVKYSSNVLAALLFGKQGQASSDITAAISRVRQQRGV